VDFENNTDKFLKIGELKAIIHKIFDKREENENSIIFGKLKKPAS